MKSTSLLLLCLITFTTTGAMYVAPKVIVPKSAECTAVADLDLSCFDSNMCLGATLRQIPLGLCGQSPTPEEQLQDTFEALDTVDVIDRNGAKSPEPNSATILHSFTKEPVSRHKLVRAVPIISSGLCYTTAMIEAVKREDLKSFLTLLKSSNLVDVPDCHGRTPLHYALLLGLYSYFCRLLAVYADPNIVDEQGDTPLHLAVRGYAASTNNSDRGMHKDIIALLFVSGADPSIGAQSGHAVWDELSNQDDVDELQCMLKQTSSHLLTMAREVFPTSAVHKRHIIP